MAATPKRLSVLWTKNLRDSDKENFQATVTGSISALRRLKELLAEFENDISKSELTEADFLSTDWSHKAAFRNGQRSAYNKIKELLNWIDT